MASLTPGSGECNVHGNGNWLILNPPEVALDRHIVIEAGGRFLNLAFKGAKPLQNKLFMRL